METLGDLLTNPILNAVTLGLGVISLTLAIVFYRKGRRVKEPCWAVRSTNLIRGYGSRFADLEVLYKGKKIEDISIARVMFWNRGAETIERQDIVDSDHLRLVGAEHVRFLDVRLLRSNNEPSGLYASMAGDGGSVHVGFDYLDQDQGVVFQVFHTGTSSKDIQLVGSIKGVKALRRVDIPVLKSEPLPSLARRFSWEARARIISLPNAVFLIFMLGVFVNRVYETRSTGERIFGGILALLLLLFIVSEIPKWLRRQVPRGLEVFHEVLPN